MECSCEDTADPVGAWIDIVHPVLPENRKHGVRANDSVEEGEHDEKEWQDLSVVSMARSLLIVNDLH